MFYVLFYFLTIALSCIPQANSSHYNLFFNALSKRYVVEISGVRLWSNGTFANSCSEYKNPPLHYEYKGATGNGTYNVAGSPIFCAMDTPSFEPGTDGGPPIVNNYRIEPNGSSLRIVNADNGAVLVASIGEFINDANNHNVCKLEVDNFSLGNTQTMTVADGCKWLLLKANSFELFGQLLLRNNTTTGGTFLAQDFDGNSRSYTIVQKNGGSGGNGGNGQGRSGAQYTALGRTGGSQSQGGGGGGGSGGLITDGGNPFGVPTNGNFGASSRSGGAGGNAATQGAAGSSAHGGAGGSYGSHGQGLLLDIQNLTGSGLISVAGNSGGPGGSTGSNACALLCNIGGSGGGGGGAGGSGGIILKKIINNSSSISFIINGGLGGAGAGAGASYWSSGTAGLGWSTSPGAGTAGGTGETGDLGTLLDI